MDVARGFPTGDALIGENRAERCGPSFHDPPFHPPIAICALSPVLWFIEGEEVRSLAATSHHVKYTIVKSGIFQKQTISEYLW